MLGHRAARSLLLGFAALGMTACVDNAPSQAEEVEFRNHLRPNLGFGIDFDTALFDAPDLDGIECLIWDLQGGRVYAGPASDDVVIGIQKSEALVSPTGTTLCSLDDSGLVPRLRRGHNGPVLYSAIGPYVFEGATELSFPPSSKQVSKLLDVLRLTFAEDRVFDGSIWNGEVILWTTKPVQMSTPFRKMLIAALVDGECGGQGLPHAH